MSASDTEFQSRMKQLDGLLQEADAIADPAARAATGQVIHGLLEFHGEAIARVLQMLGDVGESGNAVINEMAHDDLIGSMLLLYNLHPHDLETRVRTALQKIKPSLGPAADDIELIEVAPDGIVRVAMHGHGCASTAARVKATLEQAISDHAPDATSIRIEQDAAPAASGFVPLASLVKSASSLHLAQGAV